MLLLQTKEKRLSFDQSTCDRVYSYLLVVLRMNLRQKDDEMGLDIALNQVDPET